MVGDYLLQVMVSGNLATVPVRAAFCTCDHLGVGQ